MWSDTWGTLLLGLAALLLIRSSVRLSRMNLPLLATLEAWAYVVRPTSSLVVIGTTVYVAMTDRKYVWRFLAVLVCWAGLFASYSWSHFHRLLPDYYAANAGFARASGAASADTTISW